MNRIINDNDIFKLIQKTTITCEDYQVLFMLYQPIIGVEAINLYLTLVHEKILTARINLDFNHGRLKAILKLSTTQLIIAFQQLEAAKLISTYYYALKGTYIYEILTPLPANLFFTSNLNTELQTQLDSLNYERQKFYFHKNNVEINDNYINISEHEASLTQPLTLKNTLNNIYNINSSANNKFKFAFPLTPKATSNLKSAKVNLHSPSSLVATSNNVVIKNTINLMQVKTPEEYLLTLTGKTLTTKLKMTLAILINEYHLNNAIINCLIEYVWFKNNKRLEPNYIIKIAQTFQENNINNIEDALSHLKLAYAHSKNHNPHHRFQQTSLWSSLDETKKATLKKIVTKQETIKNNNDFTNTMSEEEINNILAAFDAH